ncbi:MAG: CerR family C-terminal domain-containing protein [Planctomycetota bacterium]
MSARDQEVKQKLVESALKLFAEHGRDRVSVRQIAAEAGVTHGSIRHYFGTKDNLYIAALTQPGLQIPFEDPQGAADVPLSREEAEQYLRRFVRRFVGFQAKVGEDNVAALGLMQAEVSRDGGPDPVFYKQIIRPGHEHLKTIVSRIRPDITDDKVLEILTFNIIFQCVMIRIARRTIPKLLRTRRVTKRDLALIADLIVSVTLGGLRAFDVD